MAETSWKLESKKENLSENLNNNSVEEDRLSSLADTLLIEILSLLPLKSAAATSVLSKRWRHLWTQLPHLLLDDDILPWDPDNAVFLYQTQTFIRFNEIVRHILRQITSPVIQTLNLVILNTGECPKRCTPKLKSLITLISTLNVGAVKVTLDPCDLISGVIVPSCLFEIKSLVELHLGGLLRFRLPIITNGIVSLPNLKKLQLGGNIYFDNLQKLWELINSSPLLEVLSLEFDFSSVGIVNLSCPMLKSLIIKRLNSQEFVIDTPVLEQLSLHGYLGCYSFVDYPSKLIKAELSILHPNTDLSTHIPPLFQWISGVKSVTLCRYIRFFKVLKLKYMDFDFGSIFRNVTHLRLNTYSYDSKFDFQYRIPFYWFRKLKILEIEMSSQIAYDMEFLDYILSEEADVLALLDRLSLYSILDDDSFDDPRDEDYKRNLLWWEYKVYTTLIALPKCSLPNEFEFVGVFIRVSSDRSGNGFIVTFNKIESCITDD